MTYLADFDIEKQYQATVKKTQRLTPEKHGRDPGDIAGSRTVRI